MKIHSIVTTNDKIREWEQTSSINSCRKDKVNLMHRLKYNSSFRRISAGTWDWSHSWSSIEVLLLLQHSESNFRSHCGRPGLPFVLTSFSEHFKKRKMVSLCKWRDDTVRLSRPKMLEENGESSRKSSWSYLPPVIGNTKRSSKYLWIWCIHVALILCSMWVLELSLTISICVFTNYKLGMIEPSSQEI